MGKSPAARGLAHRRPSRNRGYRTNTGHRSLQILLGERAPDNIRNLRAKSHASLWMDQGSGSRAASPALRQRATALRAAPPGGKKSGVHMAYILKQMNKGTGWEGNMPLLPSIIISPREPEPAVTPDVRVLSARETQKGALARSGFFPRQEYAGDSL